MGVSASMFAAIPAVLAGAYTPDVHVIALDQVDARNLPAAEPLFDR